MADKFVKVTGLAKLDLNIADVQKALTIGQREVAAEEAETLVAEIRILSPVRTGMMRSEFRAVIDVKLAIASIMSGRGYQWLLLEMGTEKMAAQPFISVAIKNRKSGMLGRMENSLWAKIKDVL